MPGVLKLMRSLLACALSQDQVTGLPRGFGFVHFPDPAQAHAGMVALNNSDLGGRHIYVRVRTAKGAPGCRSSAAGWPVAAVGGSALCRTSSSRRIMAQSSRCFGARRPLLDSGAHPT